MRAHNVILVTAGSNSTDRLNPLDAMLQRTLDLKLNPILVLGFDGDSVLRSSQLAENCDLVFDPNDDGGLFSGIKAGLRATHHAAFVLPLQAARHLWRDDGVWSSLQQNWIDYQLIQFKRESTGKTRPRADTIVDVFLPDDSFSRRGASEDIFPQLITTSGVQKLRQLATTTQWLDPSKMCVQKVQGKEVKNCEI